MKTKPSRTSLDETKKRRGKLILPLFLGAILVLSTFAIIFSGPSPDTGQSYTYNNLYFRLTPQGWEATVQGQPLTLRHGPQELETLYQNFSLQQITTLRSVQKIYLSTHPGEPAQEAVRELYLHSTPLSPLQFACVADVEGCGDLPIKTCSDASDTTAVVLYRIGEETSFTVDNHCYTVIAPTVTILTQMTDIFIYYLYGVF